MPDPFAAFLVPPFFFDLPLLFPGGKTMPFVLPCLSLLSVVLIVSLPAMPQAFVSYEFLSSSGNTSFSHTSLHPILTKLGHSDQYLNHYSGTNNDGVRGHDGVTGVKN